MARSGNRTLLGVLLALATITNLSLAGCRSEHPDASKAPDHSATHVPILQFAAEADPGETAGVATFESPEGAVRLRKPRSFTIKAARADDDSNGYPAFWFEIADAEKETFRRWTADLVDRRLAILVDGHVVNVPRVVSPLPGAGVVEASAQHRWSEADARELAARIRGDTPPKR